MSWESELRTQELERHRTTARGEAQHALELLSSITDETPVLAAERTLAMAEARLVLARASLSRVREMSHE